MCGCFLILVGAMFPRTALVLLELFTNWNDRAFDSFWVGFIGFLFLPYTTLTFVLMDVLIDRSERDSGRIAVRARTSSDVGAVEV